MKNFVKKAWLEENINKDNLIILDARADLSDPEKGMKLYEEGHIKGAHFVSLEDTMTGELGIHGGRHPLPDMKRFVEDMKGLGIHDDSLLVIYDDGALAMAARLWWLLKYIGKSKVYILEGGFDNWLREGGEITDTILKRRKSKGLSLNINSDIRVNMEYVRDSIGKEGTVLIDARSYERYLGEVEPLDKFPGRIPSAMNLPWDSFLNKDGIDMEDIGKLLEPLFQHKEIIVYCGSGVSGTVPYIFMDEIGLKPKLYPGSYSDWISYDENQVEVGDKE